MKKSKFKNVLFSLAVVAGLGSFIYINSVQIEAEKPKCNKVLEMDIEEDQSEVVLPEVQLVKKILEKGKELLPATHF